MRVISGEYRGRILKSVNILSVRPATDRVKQTIFDVLSTRLDLEGAMVLDLFAGSGSLGIEALSRGAAHATFVETNRDAARCIRQNLTALGCLDRADVLEEDALWFVRSCRQQYALVFADPPYAYEHTAGIPELVFTSSIVQPGGYLVVEHPRPLKFTSTEMYVIGPEKTFGRTVVTFFRHPQSD